MTAMLSFGALLKQLRKRAGMTQRDLAAALNYSDSFISSLENAQRQPDVDAVIAHFIPALGLHDDPTTAALLIERAAAARGERPPDPIKLYHITHRPTQEEQNQHPSGLPTPADDLIGRDEEVHRLCNRLRGHGGRLLTLVGPPGIGKTRLALAVAARIQRHYPDGAVFVPLAAITDPIAMASIIAAAVGGSEARVNPPHVRLIEVLRRKQMLLVLDNCEQIVGAALLIAEVVAECPRLSILATSRERLHLRAEQRYRIPPLELAAAVELFAQRAAALDADFTATEANRPILEAICQRLDCLPLAVELCAAQIDLFAPAQILQQMRVGSLDLLVDGAHDLPPQHRTLRNAIARSHELLAEHERVLFRRLGVFVGGWSLEAMDAVCACDPASDGQVLVETLHALIGKSLVRTETTPAGARRFLMLEAIREYALEQLRSCDELAVVQERHSNYFLALAERARTARDTATARLALEHLAVEHDNLRAVLVTLDICGCHLKLARLCAHMAWFWWYRGHYEEARRWSERTLVQHAHLSPALQAFLRLECSWFWPRIEQQIYELETSLALYRTLDDPYGTAWALVQMSIVYHRNGDYEAARGPAEEALLLAHALGNPALLAAALTEAGEAALAERNPARARPLLEEALTLYRGMGNEQHISGVLFLLGDVAEQRGEYRAAEALFAESAALRRTMGDQRGAAAQIGNVGRMALRQGGVARAARLQREALSIYWELGWEQGIGWTLVLLAENISALGHHERVARLLGAEEQIRGSIGYRIWPEACATYERLIAATRAELGEPAFATAWAQGRVLTLEQAVAEAFQT